MKGQERNIMKRKVFAMLCMAAVACTTLSACGGKNSDTETQAGEVTNGKSSGDYELNVDELVTSICDYSAVPVTLTSSYEVTDENIQSTYESMLSSATGSYTEIKDRTTIQKGDYVLVDYTGYLDGEAFDGGAATDQYVLVSDDNGYIDGFTDGLVGQEVGSTVTSDVTFPDPYQNNTDLSGKTTQFEFVIKGIYESKKLSPDTVTDADVEANFKASYGVSTVEELKEYAKNYLTQYNDYYKYQETITGVKDYMIANCEVTVPDEYLQLRLNEYVEQFKERYVTSDYTDLDDYLAKTYNTTTEEAMKQWETDMSDIIKGELIFEKIAKEEGIEIDEDKYAQYVTSLVQNYSYADEDAMYEGFGNGNKESGKTYVRRLYLIQTALNLVAADAKITVDENAGKENTETTESAE